VLPEPESSRSWRDSPALGFLIVSLVVAAIGGSYTMVSRIAALEQAAIDAKDCAKATGHQ